MLSFIPFRGALRAPFAALCAAMLLTGCSSSFVPSADPGAAASTLVHISGKVHGGVYPVQQATVRLWETQSNGYGGAAKQLLPSTVSDASGNFSFNDYFTCDSGQYAYITVSSGFTATNAVNNNMIQVGVLGNCSQLQSQSQQDNVAVYISELSTIAAAYAMGNFMTIDNSNAATGQQLVNISAPANNNSQAPACSGSGSSMTCTANGLGHAFTNAYNLVDSLRFDGSFPTGNARTASPSNIYSIVPQAEINTFANILQSCVDSPGGVASDGSHCGDLFLYATPPSLTAPTNTLQAALNMAKYPANNVTALFSLQPRAVFFSPYMTSKPTDLSLSIVYGVNAAGQRNAAVPVDLALDATDQLYVLSEAAATGNTYTNVQSWYADGSNAYTGAQDTSHKTPLQIAVDGRGLFYTNDYTSLLSNAILQGSTADGGLAVALTGVGTQGLAVDRSNDLWTANTGLITWNSVAMYNGAALLNLKLLGLALSTPTYSNSLQGTLSSIAIDGQQNAWAISPATSGTAKAVQILNGGTLAAPSYNTVLSTNLKNAGTGFSLAINSANNAFFPLTNALNQTTSTGSTVTSSLVSSTSSAAPGRSQADGNGAIFWANNQSTGNLLYVAPGASSAISVTPCVAFGGACVSATGSSNTSFAPQLLKGLAIDSSGDVWVTSSGGYGEVIQVMGVAAPTWPLLSYGNPGVKPQ